MYGCYEKCARNERQYYEEREFLNDYRQRRELKEKAKLPEEYPHRVKMQKECLTVRDTL